MEAALIDTTSAESREGLVKEKLRKIHVGGPVQNENRQNV